MIEMNVVQVTTASNPKEVSAKIASEADSFENKLKEKLVEKQKDTLEGEVEKGEEKPRKQMFKEEMAAALQGLNPSMSMLGEETTSELLPETVLSPVSAETEDVLNADSLAIKNETDTLLKTMVLSEPPVQGIPVKTDEILLQQPQQVVLDNTQGETNGLLQIETITQPIVQESIAATASPQQQEPFLQSLQQDLKPQQTPADIQENIGTTEIPKATDDNVVPVMQKTTQESGFNDTGFGRQSEELKLAVESGKVVETSSEPIVFNRDTTFVKISDASSKLESASPQQQVIEVVKQYVGQDKSEFSVQLFPEHLGKVDVKMVMQNGMLIVEIAAENPRTQSLLLSNVGEIKELIQASTVTTAQIIGANQSEQAQQHYTQQETQQEHQGQSQQEAEQHHQPQEKEMDFFSMLERLQLESRIQRMSL